MVKIAGVIKGSVADMQGVRKGERVLAVSGKNVDDMLDLHYLTSKSRCTIKVLDRKGNENSFIFREKNGQLGIIPEPVKVKKCKNKCVFCFVHQLPRGLRKTLYVKDEDYRLSFLAGNFVTLSDITDDELRKIIRYRLTPIYVSIHTTDNELRRKMLGNPFARDIIRILEKLTRSGITVHGQIVLCPGINDGNHLQRTVEALGPFSPGLSTIALVPVGLTVHREGLPPIKSMSISEAANIVTYVEAIAKNWRKYRGYDFLYASDEFYLMSEKRLPSEKRYGDYPQIENGVGIVRKFTNSVKRFSRMKTRSLAGLKGIAVTGVISSELIKEFIGFINKKTGSSITVLPVENKLFGKTVTVTGLLSGNDVARAVMKKRGDFLFIPSVMVRESGDRFLDDLSPEKLERITGKRVIIFDPDPIEFYWKCLEIVYN